MKIVKFEEKGMNLVYTISWRRKKVILFRKKSGLATPLKIFDAPPGFVEHFAQLNSPVQKEKS